MKQKKKFNFVDVLIVIFVIAALIFGYRFISGRGGEEKTNAQAVFTVEVVQAEQYLAEQFAVGDKIYESAKGAYLGEITEVRTEPSRQMTTDTENGTYTFQTYDHLQNVYITIAGTPTSVTERHIQFSTQKIKVGTYLNMKSADYVASGHVVEATLEEGAQ